MHFALYHVGMMLLVAGLLALLAWQASRANVLAWALLLPLGLVGFVGAAVAGGAAFAMARLLAYLVFLYVPLFLLGSALICWRRFPAIAWAAVVAAALLCLIMVDAFVIEPHWLAVTRVNLSTPKLDQPLRIVLVADLQTDRAGPYELRALREAMAQEPDVLLFAGDYVHLGARSEPYEAEIARLDAAMQAAEMQAPLGIVAIAGNIDEPGQWQAAFDGLEATLAEDTERVALGPVVITALSLQDSYDVELSLPSAEAFHVVLGHSPNFALGEIEADLLLAGHTHGGQVRLPFLGPLFTLSWVPRSWAAGTTTIAPGKTLIVSRGVGMDRAWAPRLRFLCRPELVVIDLVPEP